MERDEKGRFLKGNTIGITTEVAREYQLRSAAKRKENRTMRQILREEIEKDDRKARGLLALIEKYERGDLAALDRVRDLLDEKDDENRAAIPSFNLIVNGDTAEALKKLSE